MNRVQIWSVQLYFSCLGFILASLGYRCDGARPAGITAHGSLLFLEYLLVAARLAGTVCLWKGCGSGADSVETLLL